jgi:hypothetical protein
MPEVAFDALAQGLRQARQISRQRHVGDRPSSTAMVSASKIARADQYRAGLGIP